MSDTTITRCITTPIAACSMRRNAGFRTTTITVHHDPDCGRSLRDLSLPNVDTARLDAPTGARLAGAGASTHAPRFLLLYGSLRERLYSKLLTLEAARLLIAMGGSTRPAA